MASRLTRRVNGEDSFERRNKRGGVCMKMKREKGNLSFCNAVLLWKGEGEIGKRLDYDYSFIEERERTESNTSWDRIIRPFMYTSGTK